MTDHAVVERLLVLLEAGASEGRQVPMTALVRECTRCAPDADPSTILWVVRRRLRLRVDLHRIHIGDLEHYCRGHRHAGDAHR